MILKARFVVPIDTPVIENGAIAILEGRILRVGSAKDFGKAGATDFGDAVILPGLVNSHTHLELTHLRGRVPPTPDFSNWLRQLIEIRNQDRSVEGFVTGPLEAKKSSSLRSTPAAIRNEEKLRAAVTEGISMSLVYGVTTVGDISANPRIVRRVLADSWIRAVSYGEVIGVGKGRTALDERLSEACNIEFVSRRLHPGISPHSPYTVEPQGLRKCAEAARRLNMPVCIHAAESQEEDDFTRLANGPLADFIAGLGLWDDGISGSGCSPVELLAKSSLLGHQTLLAHANYVSDSDIELIARTRSNVVFCPRTHAAFGHAPHRHRDMEQAGVNVCLGTDSLASNPSLNLMDEVRFLYGRGDPVDAHDLIRLATINGAVALGIDEQTGSLTPGKSADVIVLPLAPGASNWREILRSESDPIAVYCNGKQIRGFHD